MFAPGNHWRPEDRVVEDARLKCGRGSGKTGRGEDEEDRARQNGKERTDNPEADTSGSQKFERGPPQHCLQIRHNLNTSLKINQAKDTALR